MIINASVSSAGALAVALAGGAFTVTGFDATASLGAGSLDISLLRATTLTAPAAAYLGVTNQTGFSVSTAPSGTTYEPLYHEITYIWTVRGSPLTLENPGLLNMPTVWKDPNLAYGAEVMFAFNDAGTYDVDLWAVDETGITGTATYQIVVTAANDDYPTTKTICYSETDFTGKPTGAQEVGTLGALNSALAAATGDIRVMFRGGEVFDLGGQIDCAGLDSVAFTTFGAGGRATVNLLRQGSNGNLFDLPQNIEMKVHDLNLAGDWDAVRERGITPDVPVNLAVLCDSLYHRVQMSGFDTNFSPYPSGACLYAWSEVEVTNWQNFGLYGHEDLGGLKYYGFRACSVYQHIDAGQGYSRTMQNSHGPFRMARCRHTYFGMCDLFSRNGWSGSGISGSLTADQPCIRLNTSSALDPDVHTTMDRVACEGGFTIINMQGSDAGYADVAGNYVFDKLLTVGSPETTKAFNAHFGGTTVRNWLHVEPNVKKNSGGVYRFFELGVDTGEETTANTDSPCAIYNSTIYSPMTAANNKFSSASAPGDLVDIANGFTGRTAMTNFDNDNNVYHAPNQTTPDTTFAPIDTTTAIAGFTPRFAGKRESLRTYTHNLAGDVTSPSGTFTVAYSNLLDKDGAATNQAYWTGRDAGDVLHALYVGGGVDFLYASEGEFDVSFDASVVTITNTSGVTWASGANVEIRLDHSSLRPTVDASYSTTGVTIPTGRPTSGSSAIGAGDTGRKAYDDFELTVRPSSGADKGAVEA